MTAAMGSLYVRCVTVKSRENEWLGDWVTESKSGRVEEWKSNFLLFCFF